MNDPLCPIWEAGGGREGGVGEVEENHSNNECTYNYIESDLMFPFAVSQWDWRKRGKGGRVGQREDGKERGQEVGWEGGQEEEGWEGGQGRKEGLQEN